jgi:hypothetical protein
MKDIINEAVPKPQVLEQQPLKNAVSANLRNGKAFGSVCQNPLVFWNRPNVKTMIRSCLIGALIATLFFLIDVFTQIKREIGVVIVRYVTMIIVSGLIHQYRKLERFLPDKTAKKASFKLWARCAIVLGLFYVGMGYGFFLAIFLIFVMFIPFLNNDTFHVVFDAYRVVIISGFILGNAVYITCVLKWKLKK